MDTPQAHIEPYVAQIERGFAGCASTPRSSRAFASTSA
jgi:hypothetical protein